jgi:xylan 1,4-beta-xylosidase
MKSLKILFIFLQFSIYGLSGQSVSFKTYLNPVIPGDHPDPTLTKVGNDFYTSGSSFNPTPKIYHSTDLVHWQVIAQPVSASWFVYGDEPGGGIWGGHTVFYNGLFWHYFGRGGGNMYFVTAQQPEGPWSNPVQVQVPAGLFGLGVDNSIFIDDDTAKWYLLTKAGQENNHIVELGEDGQPTGKVLDLTWLNPNAEGNPYGWAEGPVMWKYKGYYYYSFAQHLVGEQYVMRSDTLTDDESAWTIVGTNIFSGTAGTYNRPNHIAPVVMLDDSTSWTIAHSYHSSNNWYAQGRQGLLCQVTYNEQGFPVIQYPPGSSSPAPLLPDSSIPWMVPESDMFNAPALKPAWSHLGYTSAATYSLEVDQGWLYLEPSGESNTVIQNDGEHNYSLITRVDFKPQSQSDEAGLWIINGPETHAVKVYSTLNTENKSAVAFSFATIRFDVENTIGNIVWLKLIRNEHIMSGFYSTDGNSWIQIGDDINALDLDIQQTEFNNFTGSQQGLFVKGTYAFFDLYIYRDAYTPLIAGFPANQFGTSVVSAGRNSLFVLGNINNNDWAMFAGVEFGSIDYKKYPLSMEISASSDTDGGIVEVWLDSIDTGKKIAECPVTNTGGLSVFNMFVTDVDSVSGCHDVYLRFSGNGSDNLFRINWFRFLSEYDSPTALENQVTEETVINRFILDQNFPNPFNAITHIDYTIQRRSNITLKIFNLLGKEIITLYKGFRQPGRYRATFDGTGLSSGIYIYKLNDEHFEDARKFILLK